MDNIPGSPRSDVDPTLLEKKLDELTSLVGQLMNSHASPVKIGTVATSNPKCFIVMPFGRHELEELYKEFLLPALEECDLECRRGDDIFGSNAIMEDVRASIASADLVIADLTGQNPNVFYEVGIAHTLDKPVLLLSNSMEDVPFDLRHRRVLPYEYTPIGCKRLVSKLKEHVKNMLRRG